MLKKFLILFIVSLIYVPGQIITKESPRKILKVEFSLINGKPYYSLSRFNEPILKASRLGFEIKNVPGFDGQFTIESMDTLSFDDTWTQVWGEKKLIRNNYNQLKINLTSNTSEKLSIIFRIYDDGLGFRYEIPKQENLKDFEIMNELTEFAFTDDHESWFIKAFQWNRYEYLYENSPLSELDTVHTPVTFETKDDLYISLHEAALTDYSSMGLELTKDYTLKAALYPWSDGSLVKAYGQLTTPWRTIQVADTPGELITSYLILNLNEPNKLEDVSWIKPGKYVGIWWEMHIDKASWGSGEKHGATTKNAKKYIDFAAEHGFDGVLIEGWNKGWDGDWVANGDQFSFIEPYDDFDIKEITSYGKEKGVRLIGHHETAAAVINYENQMKDAFELYNKLGVRAVKTGYVNHGKNVKRIDENGNIQYEWHHGQYMVRHYRKVIEEAAKHQIMLDVHEPIKDTGIRRTFPNMMTREGARGEEYDAWSADGGNPPDHTTIIPFTRLLSGPMDFTPGIFDLMIEQKPNNRVNTTLAKQLAHYVVIYSPLHMAADLPENYQANIEPFKFIKDVPTDWDDTKVLNASIGNYITIARKDRNSDEWFLGSITDEKGRLFEISLSFLMSGKKYVAEIYKDGTDADWISNPYAIDISEQLVDNSSILNIRLAPGGGQAIRFRLANPDDLDRLSSN